MRFNKKASLEISIQAIVIVVLAMTLLGLGLGFIKGMFGGITDISRATFDKVADQLQRDLTNTDQKLIFSQTKIALQRGRSELFGWGIRNDQNARLDYMAEFAAIKCPSATATSGTDIGSVCEEGGGVTLEDAYSGAGTGFIQVSNSDKSNEFDINEKWFIFKYGIKGSTIITPYSVEAGDQAVERVVLSIPKGVAAGLYLITLSVYEEESGNSVTISDDPWATTDIFVTVT